MEQGKYLHVIGVGNPQDWEAGRGCVYYVEDRNGEICIPVFTTPERASGYIDTTLQSPEAHIGMLGSVPVSHLNPLMEGRFVVLPLDAQGLGKWAAAVSADYLVRDLHPGEVQEMLRFDK